VRGGMLLTCPAYIKETFGDDVPLNALFDIQVRVSYALCVPMQGGRGGCCVAFCLQPHGIGQPCISWHGCQAPAVVDLLLSQLLARMC
jgi:hypothetical protein